MTDVTEITTGNLIAAEKVSGTTGFNLAGEKLGTVDDVMIDKVSGRAILPALSHPLCQNPPTTMAREYNKRTKRFVKSGRVDVLARVASRKRKRNQRAGAHLMQSRITVVQHFRVEP